MFYNKCERGIRLQVLDDSASWKRRNEEAMWALLFFVIRQKFIFIVDKLFNENEKRTPRGFFSRASVKNGFWYILFIQRFWMETRASAKALALSKKWKIDAHFVLSFVFSIKKL